MALEQNKDEICLDVYSNCGLNVPSEIIRKWFEWLRALPKINDLRLLLLTVIRNFSK